MTSFDPAKAYNSLPPLPPKADLDNPKILKACIPASRALAELKQAGGLLPNQERMTIGTLFTLFVTPAVYTYVAREHRAEPKAQVALPASH